MKKIVVERLGFLTSTPEISAKDQALSLNENSVEERTFTAKTAGNDLVFAFGDHSTHAGEFVFQHDVGGKLTKTWSWPVQQFIAIDSRIQEYPTAYINIQPYTLIYNRIHNIHMSYHQHLHQGYSYQHLDQYNQELRTHNLHLS